MGNNKLEKFKIFILKYRVIFSAIISFVVPLSLYAATLETKLIGGDTSWFAIHVPQMTVLVPTGYPSFSIAGKLISLVPIGDLAYRLNLLSAIFGALTVLLLFLAINLVTKNEVISLASSLAFAFTFSFWTVANRFEMDTMNTFFLALIIYAALLYKEKPDRKNLYFAMASLGLFLTDHPIAMFVMPSMLIFIIVINPRIFKSIKAILLGILFFILPFSLYLWLPIRSLQGYGSVKSLRDFLYYVTGRYTTGEIHGGNFGDKDLAGIIQVTKEFFIIIYNNFGLLLIIIAIAGLIYCFVKNYKFALCSLLLIISNFLIIGLYIGWAPENHVLDSIIITAIYTGYGFLLIIDAVKWLIKKAFKHKDTITDAENKGRFTKKQMAVKTAIITVLLLAFLAVPVLMAAANYDKADASEVDEIYLFWNRIFSIVEPGSSIYVASLSANIGSYINIYEQAEKKIEYHFNGSPTYSEENIRSDLDKGKKVYCINLEDFINQNFNYTQIIDYHWPRFTEHVVLYELTGYKVPLTITSPVKEFLIEFGKSIKVEYTILNDNNVDVVINSIELEVPENLHYDGIAENSGIKIEPGFSQGKYMWVKDFNINAKGSLNIAINIRATKPGESEIGFSVTSQNIYFKAENIKAKVQ